MPFHFVSAKAFWIALLFCFSMPASMLLAQDQQDDTAGQDDKKETVYSGPQVGEKLTSFSLKHVYGEKQGEAFDPVKISEGKPIVLVFVHERSRPAFGLARIIVQYCNDHSDQLTRAICFLTDDPTETQTWLSRIKNYFPKGTPIGISTDGIEGPGAYGLNRNVALTILVGNQNKVVANYALVQPGAQADGPKILKSIAKAIGEKDAPNLAKYLPSSRGRQMARTRIQPELLKLVRALAEKEATKEDIQKTIESIEAMVKNKPQLKQQLAQVAKRYVDSQRVDSIGTEEQQAKIKAWAKFQAPQRRDAGDPKLTGMLRSMIQKSNSDEKVDEIAKSIEDYVKTNESAKSTIARISKTIAGSDRLSNYGTPHCQEWLKKWAKKYNPK